MLRMEIALFLVLALVAYIYFSAGRKSSPLHRTFSVLLVVVLVHLVFDALTVYTVNRLDSVPPALNDILHRLFIGSMVFALYLFYQYIAILVEEESGRPRRLDLAARIYLAAAELGALLLPVEYTVTPQGNYSDGMIADVCYVSVMVYLLLCAGLLLWQWKRIDPKKKFVIGAALVIELSVSALQGLHPTWLISGMGMTLMTLSFYLTLENPDILRAELTEQKMSMQYLKSQVNPHFLYNTLDTIRIQAQLDGDAKVAWLLMQLVDFFRQSVKVDRGSVRISAQRAGEGMEISVCDSGSGFAEGKRAELDAMLENYARHPAKLEGNSIGVLNVQKRIKLLCGREYGLSYTENKSGGVTAHIFLPVRRPTVWRRWRASMR